MVNKEQSLKELAEVLGRSVYCPDCEWWYDTAIPNLCTHLGDLKLDESNSLMYTINSTDYDLEEEVHRLTVENKRLNEELVIEHLNPNRRAEIIRLVKVIDDLIEMLLKRSLTFPEQHFIEEYRANGEI